MRFALRASLATLMTLMTTLAACSDGSDQPAPAKYTAPDSSIPIPPLPDARAPISLIVKGHGHVATVDGTVDCGESGALDGGTCSPPDYQVVLYAAPYYGWGFDHWEPGGSTVANYMVQSWSPDPITAVFTPLLPEAGAKD